MWPMWLSPVLPFLNNSKDRPSDPSLGSLLFHSDLYFTKDILCGEHSLSYLVTGDGVLHIVSGGLRARCQFCGISVGMIICPPSRPTE